MKWRIIRRKGIRNTTVLSSRVIRQGLNHHGYASTFNNYNYQKSKLFSYRLLFLNSQLFLQLLLVHQFFFEKLFFQVRVSQHVVFTEPIYFEICSFHHESTIFYCFFGFDLFWLLFIHHLFHFLLSLLHDVCTF